MKRRDFITLLGGAAATRLLSALAQLSVPAVGYLSLGSPVPDAVRLAGLPRGLNEGGKVEDRNVGVEFASGSGWRLRRKR